MYLKLILAALALFSNGMIVVDPDGFDPNSQITETAEESPIVIETGVLAPPEVIHQSTATTAPNTSQDALANISATNIETEQINPPSAQAQPNETVKVPPVSKDQGVASNSKPSESPSPTPNTSHNPAQGHLPEVMAAESGLSGQLWVQSIIVFCILSAMAFIGLLLIKLKRRHELVSKTDTMSVISSLSLSPKRKILLVNIKGKEIAIASTESGIQVLSELQSTLESAEPQPQPATKITEAPQKQLYSSEPKQPERRKEISIDEKQAIFQRALTAIKAKQRNNQDTEHEEQPHLSKQKKQKMSLKELDELRPAAEQSAAADERKSPTLTSRKKADKKASVPKYIANSYTKQKTTPKASKGDEGSVEDITSMIREKLRNARTHD